ncbi:hypothetical protein ACO0QE_002046 [Hanseniaspora vineae]
MKYTTVALTSLIALTKFALADSQSFGLVSIRSGSSLQYSSVFPSDGVLVVGSNSGSSTSAVVTDEGYLQYDDGSYVGLSSEGQYTSTTDKSQAVTGWSIEDGELKFDGEQSFTAVSTSGTYELYNHSTSSEALGIAIVPFTKTGGRASDFAPSDSSASTSASTSASASEQSSTTVSSTAEETTTASSSATTLAPETSATSAVVAISQIGDGQIQADTATSASPVAKSTVAAVSQITDGQIQATTATSASQASKSTVAAVSQITDGQIQATQSINNGAKLGGSVGLMALAGALLL